MKKKMLDSPAGNRTRVFRVTGGDTYHYTTEDNLAAAIINVVYKNIQQSLLLYTPTSSSFRPLKLNKLTKTISVYLVLLDAHSY